MSKCTIIRCAESGWKVRHVGLSQAPRLLTPQVTPVSPLCPLCPARHCTPASTTASGPLQGLPSHGRLVPTLCGWFERREHGIPTDGRMDGRSAPLPHGCGKEGVLFEWQEANRKGLPVWWLCVALDAAWERLIRRASTSWRSDSNAAMEILREAPRHVDPRPSPRLLDGRARGGVGCDGGGHRRHAPWRGDGPPLPERGQATVAWMTRESDIRWEVLSASNLMF